MNKLNIFIVYHKSVQPDKILNKFPYKEIKENFTFYGVNELHEKRIINNNNYNDVLEYNLPIYNPFLQKRGYMETSAYLHVYWNKLYENLEYIGFCNYDMIFLYELSSKLLGNLDENTIHIYDMGEYVVENGIYHKYMHPSVRNLDFLLESYNKHFNTKYEIHDLNNKRLGLRQTNIYPIKIYKKLCSWLEVLCNEIWKLEYNGCKSENHWGVIGGFTERAIAIFNAFEFLNGIKWKKFNVSNTKAIAEEKIHYNHNHWINQFDLNIHTKFEKIVAKELVDLSNYKLITDNIEHSDNIYFIKENINKITHIYQIDNKKNTRSKSIMLYLPANCNLFKKRYLALQDNLDNNNIYYNNKSLIIEINNNLILYNIHE